MLGSAPLLAQGSSPSVNRAQYDGCPLYVPKAFTPNGDNLNEKFLIKHGEDCRLESFRLSVFDRWGRLIFETESVGEEQSWDGSVDGQPAHQGVYMYQLQAVLHPINKPEKVNRVQRQGSIVLIR